jgi:hypothetical protein
MKVFKRIVILFWLAIPANLLVDFILPSYRRYGASEFEALIMLFALLVTAVYKISKVYRAGVDRAEKTRPRKEGA